MEETGSMRFSRYRRLRTPVAQDTFLDLPCAFLRPHSNLFIRPSLFQREIELVARWKEAIHPPAVCGANLIFSISLMIPPVEGSIRPEIESIA